MYLKGKMFSHFTVTWGISTMKEREFSRIRWVRTEYSSNSSPLNSASKSHFTEEPCWTEKHRVVSSVVNAYPFVRLQSIDSFFWPSLTAAVCFSETFFNILQKAWHLRFAFSFHYTLSRNKVIIDQKIYSSYRNQAFLVALYSFDVMVKEQIYIHTFWKCYLCSLT